MDKKIPKVGMSKPMYTSQPARSSVTKPAKSSSVERTPGMSKEAYKRASVDASRTKKPMEPSSKPRPMPTMSGLTKSLGARKGFPMGKTSDGSRGVIGSPRTTGPNDMPTRAPIAKSKEAMMKYGKTAGPMLAPRSKPMESRPATPMGPKSQMGKMQPRPTGMGAKGPSPMVKSTPMTQTGARANAAMGMAQKFMKKPGFKDGGMCAPKKGKK